MLNSFNYIRSLSDPTKGFEGITTDRFYPYIAESQKCDYTAEMPSYQLYDILLIANDQGPMKDFVANNGPVSAGVYFRPMVNYESGVFTDSQEQCGNNKPDHALTIVGYGIDKSGPTPVSYWLCKNYWGVNWGEKGYIRILRQEQGKAICQLSRSVYGILTV